MTRAWIIFNKQNRKGMSKVEEALMYGAIYNPEQSFRVISHICRRTRNRNLLADIGVGILEDLVARNSLKIKRRMLREYQCNTGLRVAMASVWISPENGRNSYIHVLIKRSQQYCR